MTEFCLQHPSPTSMQPKTIGISKLFQVNSAISIRDDKFEFTVVPDRAQGGSSLSSGSVELMLLRETIRDDGRGVEEPLMDPGQFGKGPGSTDDWSLI